MRKKYFYRSLGYVEMNRFGIMMYRDALMPTGEWYPLPCSIDRLIDHLMVITHHSKSGSFLAAVNIQPAAVTNIRKGRHDVPLDWLVRLVDYSGLGLKELRQIGGLKPSMLKFDAFHNQRRVA